MIFNYIKIAIRSLRAHGAFTLINAFGLSLGIFSALVLGLYVFHIFTYDKFHKQAQDIYLVYKERITPNGVQPTYDTWVPLLENLLADYPQIETGTRVAPSSGTVTVGEETYDEDFNYIDPTFFSVFDFTLSDGVVHDVEQGVGGVIISRELSQKYFGEDNPIGRTIRIVDTFMEVDQTYQVSGVLDDYPTNSSIRPEILIPIRSIPDYNQLEDYWDGSFLYTYVLIPQPNDILHLEVAFPAFIEKIWDPSVAERTIFKLLPMAENYDTFYGDIDNAYLMLYVGLALIALAAFNFMNLATAKSIDRIKEVGVRKVLGAFPGQISLQFLVETLLIILLATTVALVASYFLLPFINQIFDLRLDQGIYLKPIFWLIVIGFVLILTVLSGAYPSFYLSQLKLGSLKSQAAGKSPMRSILVVIQFTVSVVLIIVSMGIGEQIGFMKNANLGFNTERVALSVSVDDFESQEIGQSKLSTFRNKLASIAGVSKISSSRHIPSQWSGSHTFAQPEGWTGDPMRMRYTFMDAEFFDAFEMEFLQGDGFLPDENGAQRESVILNEAGMEAFGWDNYEGKVVLIGDNRLRVVGVVKDFNFSGLQEEVAPTLMLHRPSENSTHRWLSFAAPLSQMRTILDQLAEEWTVLGANTALESVFIDENIATLYEEETRLLKLTQVFTALALIIAALGLYGLSAYVVDRKRKEISIRKVLGASVWALWSLVAAGFMIMLMIGYFVGGGLALYFLSSWLDNFAYRMDMPIEVFAYCLVAMLLLVVTTVSLKTIHATKANPVKYLRDE